MKPAFALSLSVEGIRLLHRPDGADGAWQLVGEVKLDTSDLAADLAALRDTALKLAPEEGLATKILIPNEQIRYIALDTPRASAEDVEAALDGATPYAVEDLAYAYSRGGGRTYIAAVARETLDEAEGFAVEHRFAPVAFVAAPEPFTFNGEPFFGATASAAMALPAGEMPEADDTAIDPRDLRRPRARLPWEKGSIGRAAPVITATPEAASEAVSPLLTPPEPPPADLGEVEAPAVEPAPAPAEEAAPAEPPADISPEPAPAPTSAGEVGFASRRRRPAAPEPAPEPSPEPEGLAPQPPEPEAPTEAREPSPVEEPSPEPDALPEPAAKEIPAPPPKSEPVFASRGRSPIEAPVPAGPASAGIDPAPPAALGPAKAPAMAGRPGPPPMAATKPGPKLAADPTRAPAGVKPAARKLPPPRPNGGPVSPVAPAAASPAAPVAAAPAPAPAAPAPVLAPLSAEGLAPVITGVSPEARAPEEIRADVSPTEAEALRPGAAAAEPGLFAARTVAAPRNAPALTPPGAAPARPRAPAPAPLAGAPAESGAAAPLAFESPAPAPRGARALAARLLPARAKQAPAAAASAAPAPAMPSRAAPTRTAAKPEDPEERARMTVFGARDTAARGKPRYLGLILTVLLILVMLAVAAFAAPRVVAALFGPSEEPETEFAALPEDEAGTELDSAIAATSSLISGAAAPEEAPTFAETGEALLPPEADEADEMDEAGTAPPVAARGAVPSPAEAERFYAATGVWLRAPRLPLQPRTADLDALTVSLAEPAPAELSAPRLAAMGPDAGLGIQPLPPPPGAEFPRDARGFFLATEEGTVTPQGLVIYAGRPDILPPTRPGTEAPDEPVFPTSYAPLSPPEKRLQARPESVAAAAAAAAAAQVEAEEPEADPAALPADETPGETPDEIAPDEPVVTALGSDASPGGVGLDALTAPGEPEAGSEETAPEETAADILAPWTGPGPTLRPEDAAGALALLAPDAAEATGDVTGEATGDETADETGEAEAAAPGDDEQGAAPATPEARPGEPPPAILAAWEGPAPATRPASLAPADFPQILAAWEGPRPGNRPEGLAPASEEELAEEEGSGPPEGASLATALLEITAGSTDPLATATASAVAQARRPGARPRNFAQVVAQQRARGLSPTPAPAAAPASAPAVAAAAQPTGPVPQSVASAATVSDAINLRQINLIGIYGRPGDRRALVRLANGRYLRVGVGDQLDGGQVTVIGDSALNYVKRGRTLSLQVAEG
ncbi:hypothetical protein [Pseudoroseicyclus sp. CXY001]|uniref:hypothetical protein n=1 Tax=Pseudoroseicyclus sp. CXY001 TaxID=3242492 RepID=UPI003570E519